MKTSLMTAILLLSMNSYAGFSDKIIGASNDQNAQNKEFNNRNQERLHTGKNEIVLTFDDGPTVGVTTKVLDVLKDYGIKATFFVIASKAKDQPAIMERIVNEGHIVANHSLSHHALKGLSCFSW